MLDNAQKPIVLFYPGWKLELKALYDAQHGDTDKESEILKKKKLCLKLLGLILVFLRYSSKKSLTHLITIFDIT